MTLDEFEKLCQRKRNGFKIPNHAIQGYGRMLLRLVDLARAVKELRSESRWTVTPEVVPALRPAEPYVVDLLFQNFDCGVVERLDAALEAIE